MAGRKREAFSSWCEKWLGDVRGKFGVSALAFTVLSVLAPTFVTIGFIVKWPGPLLIALGATSLLMAACAALFKNANKYESRRAERVDSDELLDAMQFSMQRISQAARSHPNEEATISFVQDVLEELRKRLEPDGEGGRVRVCVYRRDDQDRQEAHDGEDDDSEKSTAPVTLFKRYMHASGRRIDKPRKRFQDDQEPGASFIRELKQHGIYACARPNEFAPDPHYQGRSRPKYQSFVNLALPDGEDPFEEDSVSAMITCDSLDADFFTERRGRTIRAFSHLIRLALTHEATDAVVKRPEGLR